MIAGGSVIALALAVAAPPTHVLRLCVSQGTPLDYAELRSELQAGFASFTVRPCAAVPRAASHYALHVTSAGERTHWTSSKHVYVVLHAPNQKTILRTSVAIPASKIAAARKIAVLASGPLRRSLEPSAQATLRWPRVLLVAGAGGEGVATRGGLLPAFWAAASTRVFKSSWKDLWTRLSITARLPHKSSVPSGKLSEQETTLGLGIALALPMDWGLLQPQAGPVLDLLQYRVGSRSNWRSEWHIGGRVALHSTVLLTEHFGLTVSMYADMTPYRPTFFFEDDRVGKRGSFRGGLVTGLCYGSLRDP